uniref:CUB domain-containing protein n=1 Tax=Caenorhabditis tropicalis TaxID=1561998 RepID=A0A1I7UM74_9PELO
MFLFIDLVSKPGEKAVLLNRPVTPLVVRLEAFGVNGQSLEIRIVRHHVDLVLHSTTQDHVYHKELDVTALETLLRTCCIPYVPMISNGSYICGPIPTDKSSTTTACCPTGGLLSPWSYYGRNDANTLWIRTRECLTSDIGCACTDSLSESVTACPCPATMTNIGSICDNSNYEANQFVQIVVNDTKCEATVQLQATNYINSGNSDKVIYCNHDGNYTSYGTPIILFQMSPNETKAKTCDFDRPFDCSIVSATAASHPSVPVSFTCDLTSNTWQYDYNGWHVTGYNQPQLLYT